LTSERSNFLTRKALPITFFIIIVLGFRGVSLINVEAGSAEVFCMQSGMQGHQYGDGLNTSPEPHGCCCGPNNKCAELPKVAVLPSARDKSPSSASILPTVINMSPSLEFHRGLNNKPWKLGVGPPVPPYLLNLSFLC
jgi:hypothetical protein